MLKKSVFRRRLKVAVHVIVLRDSGREFQMVGPETLNTLSPNLVLVLSTMRDRSRLTGSVTSLMYAGDLLLCAMCINSAKLNWMR